MSMVQLIKAVQELHDIHAYDLSMKARIEIRVAIAAALAEAEMMNERAEQAGAEWKRAREAWQRRGDLVRSAFFTEDFDILDQFFPVTEQTTNDKEPK